MEEDQPVDGSKLTIEELVEQSITYGFEHHFPGRIRIRDILLSGFLVDYKTMEIVIGKIVKYKIAIYADSKQLDLLITSDGVDAIQSGHPIKYMTKIIDDNKHLNIQNINVGRDVVNSQLIQDFARSDIKSKNDIRQIPTDTPKKKSNQDIWEKLKSIAQILGFGAALIALITKLMDLW